MIGRLDTSDPRVTVVGAGVSGLLLADALDRAGYEVRLIERQARAGGLIATRATPFGPAESAAHSILVGSSAQALFDRLGVVLAPVHPESRARFILRRGRMRRMPLGPLEAIATFVRAYFALSRPNSGQTLAQWADRHLGRAAREYLLSPFVRGIYGVNPEDLDLALAFPALALPPGHSLISYQLHRARKGLRKARPAMMTPLGGMGALTEALTESLRKRLGERFQLGQELLELPREGNIALSVPAEEAARLLKNTDKALAEKLLHVSYTPLISVTAFVETDSFGGKVPRGVGVLIPRLESSRRILGVLFNSSSFPDRAKAGFESFTVMLGGEALDRDDAEIRALVNEELKVLFGQGVKVAHAEIQRWPRAIPRYDRTLSEALSYARESWCAQAGRILFGNYAGQVSLRGMIDSVSQVGPREAK